MKLIDIFNLMDKLYSQQEFLRLCFTLEINHENFEAQGKKNQMQEFLTLLQRRNRLPELIDIMQSERPQGHSDWESVHQATITLQEKNRGFGVDFQELSDNEINLERRELLGRQLGNYHLVEKLGEGGMAEVYKGYSAELNKFAAVKVLHTILTTQTETVARFRREARVLASLSHPHIVRLLEYKSLNQKVFYLVMEYIDGDSLRAYLENRHKAEMLLPLSESVTFILQVADALAYAHQQGVVHRDVKPANVMINGNGKAILTDFGIVKLLNRQNASIYTATGSFMGTPAYIPPEQALGGQGDVRADIYSLGVILFYMTTGRLPFTADAPMALMLKHISEPVPLPEKYNPDIPLRLQEVILRAMQKDPDRRYTSMADMICAIQLVDLDGAATPIFTQLAASPTVIPSIALSEGTGFSTSRIRAPFHVPPPIPYFAGRNRVVAELVDKLTNNSNGSVVGLVGFGGVGKTAVAIHVARQLQDRFPDGILWAQLDTSNAESELASFTHAYGQAEELAKITDIANKAEFMREILADKKVLIVLNQVTDSEQIKWLIPTGAENKTLITTRNGKILSNLNANIMPLAALTIEDGLVFLREVIGEARVDNERKAARKIIRTTGGIPLALSIAAGALNEATDLTLGEYAELLDDEHERLDNLSDWGDDTRDVSATFELSYQKLPVRLQKLFAALSIFDGPDFDSRAVASIVKMPTAQVKLGLGRLYFLSLISAGLGERDQLFPIEADGNGRYRLNSLLKLFARRKLSTEENSTLRERARDYYLNVAQQNKITANYHTLDLEWHNIFAAAQLAYETQQRDLVIQTALALTHNQLGRMGFTDQRGHYQEARDLLGWALDLAAETTPPLQRINLLTNLGGFAYKQTDLTAAEQFLSQSEALLASQPDSHEADLQMIYFCQFKAMTLMARDGKQAQHWVKKGLSIDALALLVQQEQGVLYVTLSTVLARSGQLKESKEAALKALDLLPSESKSVRITALRNLSGLSYLTDLYEEGDQYLNTAITAAESLNDLREIVALKTNQAVAAQRRSDYKKALAIFEELQPIIDFLGSPYYRGLAHNTQGNILTKMGQDEPAEQHFTEALHIAIDHQILDTEAMASINLATLLIYQHRFDEATVRLTRAEEICEASNLTRVQAELWRLQAQVLLSRDELSAAQSRLNRSLMLAQEQKSVLEEGIGWRVQGDLYAAQEKYDEVTAAYKHSLTLLEKTPFEYAKTKLAQAQQLQTKQADALRQTWGEEAMAIFEQIGAQRELQQTNQFLEQMGK